MASSNWCANTSGGYPGGFGGADSLKIEKITSNCFNLLLAHSNIYSTPNACTLTTALTENHASPGIVVFPNPTSGQFTLHRDSLPGTESFIDLYNSSGQKVWSAQLNNEPDNFIQISDLPDGVYFYLVKTETEIVTRGKIVLAH